MAQVDPGSSIEARQRRAHVCAAAHRADIQIIRASTFPGYGPPHPREIKPPTTIAYPATMVKQSGYPNLNLDAGRRPESGCDRGT
jgi:hypothetical protein